VPSWAGGPYADAIASGSLTSTRHWWQSYPRSRLSGTHFPSDVPPDAKTCQVLVAGKWVDGFLLEWRRGPDDRWKGPVRFDGKQAGRSPSKTSPNFDETRATAAKDRIYGDLC
jgi:hypothetical protein